MVTSSDNHRGYPGAWGEGVLGVWARDNSREALFEAVRARRTYAATGDRIALEFAINEWPMGSELNLSPGRQIDVRVEGEDSIQMIELIRNGRVIQRHFPEDDVTGPPGFPGECKFRINYGWGPWAALDLGRTCHWDMTVGIEGGRFVSVTPCFQSGPYEEDLRDRLEMESPRKLRLRSYTSRVNCYAEDPTKALVCAVEADPDAVVTLELTQPSEQTVRKPLRDLIVDNVVEFTGVFTSESFIVSRLIGPAEYTAQVRWLDSRLATDSDWYYVRVTQHNGQMAWSSPIWVG
ncbi:MAG: DUF3604 domain-containing protein [Planctomycetota bacterium]|nr:MAG: DUF3604 domain-containing protein [Planctomycetota bacterium]